MAFHVTDDGCRIFYDLAGESGTPCVLIPGLGGESAFWNGITPYLQESCRLLRSDHRGAGASDRPATGYSIPRLARDILGLLDALGLERAHLIGHSTGGMIAQTIAVEAPARVSSLILSGTWGRIDMRFRRMFEARLALLETGGGAAYQKLTQALGYDGAWMDRNAALLDAEIAQADAKFRDPAIQKARIEMLLNHDVQDRLTTILAPTLIIGGPEDALIPFAASEHLAQAIPGARLAALPGGHFFPKTGPEAYAREVLNFYQEIAE